MSTYIEQRLSVHRLVQAEFFDATGERIITSYAVISFLAYGMQVRCSEQGTFRVCRTISKRNQLAHQGEK